MNQWNRFAGDSQETRVAIVGVLLALLGITFRDTLGVSTIVASFGLALAVAGVAYIATAGSELMRYAVTVGALVFVPLLFFGGIVRSVGAIGLVVIIGTIAFTRLGAAAR